MAPISAVITAGMLIALASTQAAPASGQVASVDRACAACVRQSAARQDAATDVADAAARAALKTAPPRSKIGRMRGVRFLSRVTFEAAPEEPHELALSLAFPARSRLTLESADGRVERYQLGDTWFGLDITAGALARRRPSFLLTGKDRDEARLDIALRRALFLWPNGPEFTGAGTTFTSKVEGLGMLLATVDEESGRPRSIRAIRRNGKVIAELRDVVWTSGGERAWPKSLVFAAGGKMLWSEVVERVEDEWLFADTWFLPSDRIAGMVGHPIDATLRMRVVDEAWTTRSVLPPGTTRESALDLALERWSSLRDRLGEQDLKIGVAVSIELDERRMPVAVFVEIATDARADAALKDAEEWSKRGRRAAWMVLCKTLDDASESAFEAVADAVEKSGMADGSVVLRFDVTSGAGPEPVAPVATGLRIVQAFRVSDPKGGRNTDGR